MKRFDRILAILASYERAEFDLRGLEYRLDYHTERNLQIVSPVRSKSLTCVGLAPAQQAPVLWSEP